MNIFSRNTEVDGEEVIERFIDRKISDEKGKKLTEEGNYFDNANRKARFPFILDILFFIAIAAFIMIAFGIINKVIQDRTFNIVLNQSLVLFIIEGVLLVFIICMFVLKRVKVKKVVNSDEYKNKIDQYRTIEKECLEELNIPLDSPHVDVLFSFYKIKDNRMVNAFPSGVADYAVFNLNIFKEDNCLCLGDFTIVVKIPLNSIKTIQLESAKYRFYGWNKDIPYNKGEYAKYKIKSNNLVYKMDKYYSLEFEKGNKTYEIFFPEYDGQIVCDLVGMSPIDNTSK